LRKFAAPASTSRWGPQRLDHLVAREAMPVGERQKLHQLSGAAARPRIRLDLVVVDGDPKATEQLDAYAAHLGFRAHCFSDRTPVLTLAPMPARSEERFKNARPPRCINPSYYQGGLDP
jgi:hypothetical protein